MGEGNRGRRRKVVDRSHEPPPDPVYVPPPAHICEETEWTITSQHGDETHVRLRRYNHRIVDFAIQQIHMDADGTRYEIARIDCCDGAVHRHQFVRSTGEDIYDHRIIRRIPYDNGWQVVQDEYRSAFELMLAEQDENLRRWRDG
ncbi:MAG: hypothetical protein WCP28_16660 [Actinomycetes bacterium]